MESKYLLDKYKWCINGDINIDKLKSASKKDIQPHKCISDCPFDDEYQKAIEEIELIIKTRLPMFNLNIFYNNILDLIITVSKRKNKKANADYCSFANQISIYGNPESKYHELLHMATSPDEERCGFRFKDIGRALNEGYTTFLDNVYFGKYFKDSKRYKLLSEYAALTELLIGKEKMVTYYSNASLYNLIIELSKYSEEKYVKMFIVALDNIYECCDKKFHFLVRRDIQENINYCTGFIIQALDKKYKGTDKYAEIMNFAIKLLENNVTLKGYSYTKIDVNDELICDIIRNIKETKKLLKKLINL